jgi:lipoprotein-anchoring transpeptidase ErfK/SrfK
MLIASRIALAATFQFLVWGHAVDGSDAGPELIISVADQELAFVQHGNVVGRYPVSTSKFGLGDSAGSYRTPLGTLFVSGKFGDKLAAGAVIKSRNPTGEVVAPNARGRDAIISRVIWLRGLEEQNRGAHERCIYIHGTPEENRIGEPASFGCIRMRSNDVIALYERVHIGMHVLISRQKINELLRREDERLFARSD